MRRCNDGATPLDSMVTGSLTCTATTAVAVALSPGLCGSYATKKLGSGPNKRLNCNLYLDAARPLVWGDGTSPTRNVTATVVGNITFTGTVYGRIPAGQNFSAGAYTDTITVTVTN
jgi:spore coat protein U-like protein